MFFNNDLFLFIFLVRKFFMISPYSWYSNAGNPTQGQILSLKSPVDSNMNMYNGATSVAYAISSFRLTLC